MTTVNIDFGNKACSKVNNLFQLLCLQLFFGFNTAEKIGQPATRSAEVPNVYNWCSKFNVTHALTTNF